MGRRADAGACGVSGAGRKMVHLGMSGLGRRITRRRRLVKGIGRAKGGRLGWSPISGPPSGPPCCPLAVENWLWHWPRGRGSPPLRFAPIRGPPSSTTTSTDVLWPGQCRVLSESERAAGRPADTDNTTTEMTSTETGMLTSTTTTRQHMQSKILEGDGAALGNLKSRCLTQPPEAPRGRARAACDSSAARACGRSSARHGCARGRAA